MTHHDFLHRGKRWLAPALLLLVPALVSGAEPWSPLKEQAAHHIPSWARAGKIRFGLWYGGVLDMGKGILSRWRFYYPPEPDMIEASSRWYDPETIEHLKAMNLSWVWVCWSNGYSIAQEEVQWRKLKKYIPLVQKAGVRVTGYMSIGNMFWDEMLKRVPRSKDWVLHDKKGGIQLYGKAPTRYMADITNPEWQGYLKKRIDAGLAAGLDALVYDNTLSFYGRQNSEHVAALMLEHAQSRKPDVLFASNYNRGQLTWARAQNMISTEEGSVPGLYETDPLPKTPYVYKLRGESSFAKFGSCPVAVDGKEYRLVNNAGLARYLYGVAEGWRPVTIEEGAWNGADRLEDLLTPRQYQLSIAESAAFGFGFEIQFLGRFQRDLFFRRPEAMRCRDAIGHYNGFWARNEDLFTDFESLAETALLLDDADSQIEVLNYLAGNSLLFDVLFDKTLTPEQLAHYKLVVVPGTRRLDDRTAGLVRDYAAHGGIIQFAADSSKESVLRAIRERDPAPVLRLEAPGYVVANLVRQPERQRSILHLMNYWDRPVRGASVLIRGNFRKAALFTPDKVARDVRLAPAANGQTRVTVQELDLYDVVALQ